MMVHIVSDRDQWFWHMYVDSRLSTTSGPYDTDDAAISSAWSYVKSLHGGQFEVQVVRR
jgi:hypothetical protein